MARLEPIDFVKGLAITGIMFFHCYEAIYGWPGHDLFRYLNGGLVSAYTLNLNTWESTLKSLLKITGLGYQGVSVFVVLSGFLQVWSSKKDMTPDKYWTRRFIRLYPLYWLAVSGVIILNLIIQRTSGVSGPQFIGVLMGWAPLLSLNPSFWFMSLIVQLYFFFPFLQGLLTNLGEKKFLILTTLSAFLFLRVFANMWIMAGVFFGGWLIEFSLGMVMSNHFSKIDSMLGFKTIVPLFLGYVLGLYLSSSLLTWPLGRPLYGITLTLFLWSLYNIVKPLPMLKKGFMFIGINSFALFLINQPFIQEFFIFVTRFILPGQRLQFKSLISGSPENFHLLPISTYLPITLSYIVIAICLSFLFTKIDRIVNSNLNNVFSVFFLKQEQPSNTPHPKDRPLGIAINGGLIMLLGDLVILVGLAFGSALSSEWAAEVTATIAFIGIIMVASGYFFYSGRKGAWWLSTITIVLGILGIIGLLFFNISTNSVNLHDEFLPIAIPVIYLYYLMRPHVKDYFHIRVRVQETEVVVNEEFLIEAINVSKIYRIDEIEIKALNNLSFRVARGDFISIMGPSGSGKTTLLNIIGGLDKTTSGSVHFNGEDLSKLSETRLTDFRLKNVGFVFQQYNLLDTLSALENVELPTIAAGIKKEEARSKAVWVLDSVGLKHRLYNRPTQLSGGEQQRVAIARALINDPSLIIADEPTGNVDSETGLKLIELLSDLNMRNGITVIIATHDLQIANKAHRLIKMKDGQII